MKLPKHLNLTLISLDSCLVEKLLLFWLEVLSTRKRIFLFVCQQNQSEESEDYVKTERKRDPKMMIKLLLSLSVLCVVTTGKKRYQITNNSLSWATGVSQPETRPNSDSANGKRIMNS